MSEQAQAKDVDVQGRHEQVPDEVSRRHTLDEAAGPSVPPDALLPVHGLALLVDGHDPERHGVDEDALHQGHDVRVPVRLLRAVMGRVVPGEEPGRQHRRHDRLDEGVEQGEPHHFMDMERQCCEAVLVCPRLYRLAERRDRRDREWISHGVGEAWLFPDDTFEAEPEDCV